MTRANVAELVVSSDARDPVAGARLLHGYDNCMTVAADFHSRDSREGDVDGGDWEAGDRARDEGWEPISNPAEPRVRGGRNDPRRCIRRPRFWFPLKVAVFYV